MSHRRLPHIVAYDIADHKRLGRVHRYLKKIALPLQYSVFLIELDDARREKLLAQLSQRIHPKQDDIRIYPLPDNPEWVALGKALWGDGILLTGIKLPAQLRYNDEAL
ncbi:CRISPR-associated endonuclease Cas2 [Candidatus Thiothrix anitrata]|uniref:CRISPR-associated endoribonuclease Cas2 n=1 Tax=Candidatus Thiothrix anitrata TaxID=2823902 RepID=A0ABX7WY70_9GAMM|nr:CRISPR-associated endonuclease Cas2 [Candidatus Thiothrix anitrata]QTR48562.1 CRISPR-associated endonuclease Cas2 [Candidatus Thiothrix anitrata]